MKSRPLTIIPDNIVNSLYNETLTVGSLAQRGVVLEMVPAPSPLSPSTITYLRRELSNGCHQGQNVTVLDFPERLEVKDFC